jgi:hypothetical protein
MEPENLAKLLAKTGLLSATLNQDGFFQFSLSQLHSLNLNEFESI